MNMPDHGQLNEHRCPLTGCSFTCDSLTYLASHLRSLTVHGDDGLQLVRQFSTSTLINLGLARCHTCEAIWLSGMGESFSVSRHPCYHYLLEYTYLMGGDWRSHLSDDARRFQPWFLTNAETASTLLSLPGFLSALPPPGALRASLVVYWPLEHGDPLASLWGFSEDQFADLEPGTSICQRVGGGTPLTDAQLEELESWEYHPPTPTAEELAEDHYFATVTWPAMLSWDRHSTATPPWDDSQDSDPSLNGGGSEYSSDSA